MELMEKIGIVLMATISGAYPFMWVLYWIFGICEKVVHALDRKELTHEKFERGLLVSSAVLTLIVSSLIVFQ